MDQTELDQAGVKAKEEALEAAKAKDELAGHLDATQHAVDVAEEDLKRQKDELKVQYLDNSKPRGADPAVNTAPGDEPKAVDEPKETKASSSSKTTNK